MSSVMDNVQPAVKKETQRVAAINRIDTDVDHIWSNAWIYASESTT